MTVLRFPDKGSRVVDMNTGLLPDWYAGRLQYPYTVMSFTYDQGGPSMPMWLVPLLRDLGATDVRVEIKQESEWTSVDKAPETL